MIHVLLYGRIFKDADAPYVQELVDCLFEKGFDISIYGPYFEQIQHSIRFPDPPTILMEPASLRKGDYDYMLSLGGDGTILSAVTLVKDSLIPIMGINLGRLGFLASNEKKNIRKAIELLKRGMFQLDVRRLLFLETNKPLFGELSFALNDFTVLKRDTSSMITIHTFINGEYLNSYWADGIIVATPTGSTGYSLSCGGPIIFPNSGNFVITPVAPHNLNVRPIVISDDSVISFEIEGRTENFLCTLDSRFKMITADHQIAVRKCDFPINLVQLHGNRFMQTIREKLTWGVDSRN